MFDVLTIEKDMISVLGTDTSLMPTHCVRIHIQSKRALSNFVVSNISCYHHLAYTLGNQGYLAYKYVPYGPVMETLHNNILFSFLALESVAGSH